MTPRIANSPIEVEATLDGVSTVSGSMQFFFFFLTVSVPLLGKGQVCNYVNKIIEPISRTWLQRSCNITTKRQNIFFIYYIISHSF